MERINRNNRTRLAIIHNNFGPYHLARLDAACKMGKERGIEVMGLELAGQEHIHPWTFDAKALEVEKLTIFPRRAIEELRPWSLVGGVWSMLKKLDLQGIALSLDKQTFPAMLTILAWARLHQRPVILMMDSKFDDYPRRRLKEWVKRRIMSCFDGVIVAGTLSKAYAGFLGMPPERIFAGYDVVDNDYFMARADWARGQARGLRQQYGLPENYFLSVGRFDEKKNFSRLLEAYSHYTRKLGDQSWGLVLCGSGPLDSHLREKARQLSLHQVRFPGFTQISDLPIYYGLANCFILASSHSEQWGLVVNEAMASALPVLVSRACGCAPDLVQEGVNGYTFDPHDAEGLAHFMVTVTSGEVDLTAMGRASRTIIADYSLTTYSNNLFKAVALAHGER